MASRPIKSWPFPPEGDRKDGVGYDNESDDAHHRDGTRDDTITEPVGEDDIVSSNHNDAGGEHRSFDRGLWSNHMNQTNSRWEGPADRLSRFLEEYGPHFKLMLGEDYVVFQLGSDPLLHTLGKMVKKENLSDQNLGDRDGIVVRALAEVADLEVTQLIDANNILNIYTQDKMWNFKFSSGALPFHVKHGDVQFVAASIFTNYANASMGTTTFVGYPKDQPLPDLYASWKKILKVISDAERENRQIDVFGQRPIPLPPTSWSTWDNVFLPEEIIHRVRDDLQFFLNNKDFFRRLGLPYKRGFLLCGPPGNGKTTICRTIATSMPFSCYMFDFSNRDLENQDLTEAFRNATENAPAVFFMEDVDRIFDPDKNTRSNVTLDHLLNCLDGIAVNDGLVVVATANNPKNLDKAILQRPGRFDQVIELLNPAEPLRRRYLVHLFRDCQVAPEDIDQMVRRTEGVSMAFLKELFVMIVRNVVMRDMKPTEHLELTSDDVDAGLSEMLSQFKGIGQANSRSVGFGGSR